MGTARLCRGEEEGWAQLEESLKLALDAGLEEHVARAWTNLASEAVQYWQFDLAKSLLGRRHRLRHRTRFRLLARVHAGVAGGLARL